MNLCKGKMTCNSFAEIGFRSQSPIKDQRYESALSIKSAYLNQNRVKKLPTLKGKMALMLAQNDNEEQLKAFSKSPNNEKKIEKKQFQSSSKFWRGNSPNIFEEAQLLKNKLNQLRKFNLLILNDKSCNSYTSSPISTRIQLNHIDNPSLLDKKGESWQDVNKKIKPDIRDYPARFMSPKSMKKLAFINSSCAYINPKLKQDLQIIQDNSSDNLNRSFKEEKIYRKYLLDQSNSVKLTGKIVQFDN